MYACSQASPSQAAPGASPPTKLPNLGLTGQRAGHKCYLLTEASHVKQTQEETLSTRKGADLQGYIWPDEVVAGEQHGREALALLLLHVEPQQLLHNLRVP